MRPPVRRTSRRTNRPPPVHSMEDVLSTTSPPEKDSITTNNRDDDKNETSPRDRRRTSRRRQPLDPLEEDTATTSRSDVQEEQATQAEEEHSDSDDNDDTATVPLYHFQGQDYPTYQDMVHAKRRRNQDVLERSGLLTAVAQLDKTWSSSSNKKRKAVSKGLRATAAKHTKHPVGRRRTSNRLQGVPSDGLYVDEERAGTFTVQSSVTGSRHTTSSSSSSIHHHKESSSSNNTNNTTTDHPQYYRGRVNDGEPLSLTDAVELAGPKWVREDSVAEAQAFVRALFVPGSKDTHKDNGTDAKKDANKDDENDDGMAKPAVQRISPRHKPSPSSVATPRMNQASSSRIPTTTPSSSSSRQPPFSNDNVNLQYTDVSDVQTLAAALSVDDVDHGVAKLCPDRMYSIAVHPSLSSLIVAAGDKTGCVGFWNVPDRTTEDKHRVHLTRPHTGAVGWMQWTDASSLVTGSYDGTVRLLDAGQERFTELFATYDDSDTHHQDSAGNKQRHLGFGLDTGYRFWTQYGCVDPTSNGKGLFLSTSVGTAMHVDLRSKGFITFHEELSEKKINTLSLHPNGHSLVSAGLDNTVNLWDIRKLGDSRTRRSSGKAPQPLAYYNGGRSVNSAFFSPSGKYLVSTTMANKLDIFHDFHLQPGRGASSSSSSSVVVPPHTSLRHDNMTGRWLTTFQAVWHPSLDIFGVGSMRKPRCMEVFAPDCGGSGGVNGTYGDHCLAAVSGEALTAVASRVAFHPRGDQLILVGGNSSGRVTVARA